MKIKKTDFDKNFNTDSMETQFVLVGNLSEAKFDKEKRTAELTVIRKGWSLNGFYYGSEALQSIATFLNSNAKQIFLNHNKRSEVFEPRKAEDHVGDNVVASVAPDGNSVVVTAKFFESGPNAWFFDRMVESTSGIGPSIVGKARIKKGTAEGRSGLIVQDIVFLHSYDMVVKPSAGGTIDNVNESLSVPDGYMHVYEGLVSDEQKDFILEAIPGPGALRKRIKRDADQQKSRESWWKLESVFMSELSDIIQARNEYEYMPSKERRKLIDPLLSDFKIEINKLKFVEAIPLPKQVKDKIEVKEHANYMQVILDPDKEFEPASGSSASTVISAEQGIEMQEGVLTTTGDIGVVSYTFNGENWNEANVTEWIDNNINEDKVIKEGEDMEIKNLLDLQTNHPTIYKDLISEAQNDVKVKETVDGWKADSEKLETVTEEHNTLKTEVADFKKEKTDFEAKNKTLTEANDGYKADADKVRKAILIVECKKEAELTDENCSPTFNTLLENLAFDAEKEDEFKALVKEQVEDRKALTDKAPVKTVKKPIVEGANSKSKDNTTVAETTIPDNDKFMQAIELGA